MAVGVAQARAHSILDTYRNTAYAAIASVHVKLHTGDPGSAGTGAASAETDRQAVTFSAPAAGSMAASNQPQWAAWDAGPETITHISLWDASIGGTFLQSVALAAGVVVANGNTLTLSALTLSVSPVAA